MQVSIAPKDAKIICDKLFHDVFEKYDYVFYESNVENKNYYDFFYKNLRNRFLQIYIEAYQYDACFYVGDIINGERKNVKHLLSAMSEKHADLESVRKGLKKFKYTEEDNWLHLLIERELLFIEKFGDLVL